MICRIFIYLLREKSSRSAALSDEGGKYRGLMALEMIGERKGCLKPQARRKFFFFT